MYRQSDVMAAFQPLLAGLPRSLFKPPVVVPIRDYGVIIILFKLRQKGRRVHW